MDRASASAAPPQLHASSVTTVRAAAAALLGVAALPEAKGEVARLGGLPPVVGALFSHSGSAAVVDLVAQVRAEGGRAGPWAGGARTPSPPPLAAAVLQLIHSLGLSAANQAVIGKAGAIPVLLRALKEHGANGPIAERLCIALATVAGNADNRVAITRGGGTQLLLALAMRAGGAPGDAVAVAAKQALQKIGAAS